MWSSKVVPSSNRDNNAVITAASATKENTQIEGNATLLLQPSTNNIDVIIKQSTLALEVEILINNGEGGNTIYKLKGSALDWLMLVDCDFGNLGKFDLS